MQSSQYVFNFDHRPAFNAENFLISSCNQNAVAWIAHWPEWPSSTLVIHGLPGCGKSHLGQVFLARSRGIQIPIGKFLEKNPSELISDTGNFFLDDIDVALLQGDRVEVEKALLHFYNIVIESGSKLLIAAKAPPARWGLFLADLSSRLKTATLAEISLPDDDLLFAVLIKQFNDRQLRVDSDVISFVIARIERSFWALRKLVAATDQLSLIEKRRITIPLVRQALEEFIEKNN